VATISKLDRFRSTRPPPPKTGGGKMPRSKEPFIRITVSQAQRLQMLKPPPYITILQVILFESFRHHGHPFLLPADALVGSGFSRWAQWRAIVQLEKVGLISVDRSNLKQPKVTVL
jgi:hypothetical protein